MSRAEQRRGGEEIEHRRRKKGFVKKSKNKPLKRERVEYGGDGLG